MPDEPYEFDVDCDRCGEGMLEQDIHSDDVGNVLCPACYFATPCPRCGQPFGHEPGTTRIDSTTKICGKCCAHEAFVDRQLKKRWADRVAEKQARKRHRVAVIKYLEEAGEIK